MGNLAMVRCDHRLVHGQVGGQWLKRLATNKIVILCDEVAEDPFMKEMFEVSAPAGVKFECYKVDEGVDRWKMDQFGPGNIIVLFKYTIDAINAYNKGFNFGKLNIGQSSSGVDKDGNPRKLVLRAIYLSSIEAAGLRELDRAGVVIYSQGAPHEDPLNVISKLAQAGL